MAETSGFFDAVYNESTDSYDLEYLAAQFAAYFALFVGNGVFGSPTNQLKVSSGDGMTIKISPGWAFINGYWYHNDEELVLSVSSNISASSRSDAVLCRWDAGSRRISAAIQIGSTEVTRDGSYYDLKLAEILVPAGATYVPQSNITDTRMNESVCGLVTHILEVQTTADLFAQYEAIFNDWFDSVKDQATGDLAIRLQQEFTELNQKVEDYQSDVTDIANGAKTTIDEFVAKYFVIDVQLLTFVDKVCKVTDSRITSKSLVDVYFTADTMKEAESCQMYVDSFDGYVTITAEKQPESSIRAAISVRVV